MVQLTWEKTAIRVSGYILAIGIAFDGGGLWSFSNDFAGNVVIFYVDNNSSSHADNRKNNFLVLAEGPTYDINGNFGAAEKKKFSIDFSKAKTKAKSSCFYYNDDTSYFFFKQKKNLWV